VSRRLFLFLLLVMSVCLMTACHKNEQQEIEDHNKLSIVCCGFSEYDWMRNLTKGIDNISLDILIDNGTDIHSYQPSVEDMITATASDVFIYSATSSTEWMDDIAANSQKEDMLVINLADPQYGFAKCVEEHEHHGDEHTHDEAVDEHVWLSLKNASDICQLFSEILVNKDPENKDIYLNNLQEYKMQLKELDESYVSTVESIENPKVVVADRFPFIYLMKDYGIEYMAAFEGCSTETDASFQTVIELTDKIKEWKIKNLIVLENSSTSVYKAIKDNSKLELDAVEMHSMQSFDTSSLDVLTYIEYMEKNLEALSKALETNKE